MLFKLLIQTFKAQFSSLSLTGDSWLLSRNSVVASGYSIITTSYFLVTSGNFWLICLVPMENFQYCL